MKFRYVFLLIFLSFFINFNIAFADDDIPRATHINLRDVYNEYDVPSTARFDRDYKHMICFYRNDSVYLVGSDRTDFYLSKINASLGQSFAGFESVDFYRDYSVKDGNVYDWYAHNNGSCNVSIGALGKYGSSTFPKLFSDITFLYTKNDIKKNDSGNISVFYLPQMPILNLTFRQISMDFLGAYLMPLVPLVLGLMISYLALRKALKFLSQILSQA